LRKLHFCVRILATDRHTYRQTNEQMDRTDAKGAPAIASGAIMQPQN